MRLKSDSSAGTVAGGCLVALLIVLPFLIWLGVIGFVGWVIVMLMKHFGVLGPQEAKEVAQIAWEACCSVFAA